MSEIVSAASRRLRLDSLTGLRFFAAMAVVFRHYGQSVLGRSTFLQQEGAQGFLAVSFFFVLSGFVLTYSYSNEQGQFRGSRRVFYWARFARIYPAYLIAILLNLNWTYLNLRELYSPQVSILHLAVGGTLVLGLVQSWIPWTANYLNNPAWSLSVEAFFYLVFPFVPCLIRRLSRRQMVILFLTLWLCALLPGSIAWNLKIGFQGRVIPALLQCLPVLRLPEFIMGSLTARLFLTSAPRRKGWDWGTWLCCGGLIALAGFPLEMPEFVSGNGLFAPVFCLLIWFSASSNGVFNLITSSKFLVFLGEISYSIYILQEPVARWFEYSTHHSPQEDFCSYVFVLLITSAACFWFVERSVGKEIRRWVLGTASKNSGRRVQPVAEIGVVRL